MSFVESLIKENYAEQRRMAAAERSAELQGKIRKYRRIAVILFALVLLVYAINFALVPFLQAHKMPFPLGEADKWGQFGDFVGGLLNPILAGFAFYWLTESVRIQDNELSETREALLDSARSQQAQVELQEKMARINALNVIITAQTTEINAVRDSIKFVTEQFLRPVEGTRQFFNIRGQHITRDEAIELLKALQNQLDNLSFELGKPMRDLRELLGKDYRVPDPKPEDYDF